jgi:hypothetical protein
MRRRGHKFDGPPRLISRCLSLLSILSNADCVAVCVRESERALFLRIAFQPSAAKVAEWCVHLFSRPRAAAAVQTDSIQTAAPPTCAEDVPGRVGSAAVSWQPIFWRREGLKRIRKA